MKNERTIMIAIAVYAAAMVMIFNMLGAHAQNIDFVKSANAANENTFDRDAVNENVACFFIKFADTKRMTAPEEQKSYGIQTCGSTGGENLSHDAVAIEKFKK
jgi:hypothetical protein